jgi:WD40 repeat protein/serine/threonine protein kinase
MDERRWEIAKRILADALALPPEHRMAWIKGECEDEELRREVLELLRAHDEAEPPRPPPSPPDDFAPTEGPGAVIGRYKLLEKLGEGGFGAVYMAEQTEPVERRVALKIIKPGMDTRQVIARFEAERQALAMMDHPNIAKVLDAGATDAGRPYFVMELVKGIPITDYCDQERLTPRQRLGLFARVCHGVQHAHQKGIIHRDLKPSNVLVAEYDGVAVPKIIDFGVAKATGQKLTEKTMFTQMGQLVGTLEYMSPEQTRLNQLDIDTRSDVYSLGVLLYELLTGTTPFERSRLYSAAFDEILRIIREEEPPRPSTRISTMSGGAGSVPASRGSDLRSLGRVVKGELDWIVMRSLEKDRNRRYDSAASFAADLERYLGGEAVLACPPSTVYRLRKFVRRHRGAVTAATALALMLCLGLVGTSIGLVQASDARHKAVAARDAERHLTFTMALDRGLATCDQGSVGTGMLWLARALELCPADEPAMARVIRANLNAWRSELNSLEMILPHEAPVICVAFSPDGTQLVTGSTDDTAQLWDARTGERIGGALRHGNDVHELAFSPDGSRILSTDLGTTAFLWDAKSGRRLFTLESGDSGKRTGGVLGGAFLPPDGSRVITSYADGTVTIWDAERGNAIEDLPLSKHHAVHDIAIRPDGTRLLTACHDGTAQIWEIASGKLLATFKHAARVATAAFRGKAGNQVVTGDSDGNVYLWNVADALKDPDHTLETAKGEYAAGPFRHGGIVHRLRVDPDGSRILSGSFDTTARLWDPDGAGSRPRFEHQAAVQGVALHPDGVHIGTACDDGAARLWRQAPGLSVRTVKHPLRGNHEALYAPGGDYVLTKTDEETVLVRDAEGNRLCGFPHPGGIRAFDVSPDRSRILIGGADGTSQLRDVATGRVLFEHRNMQGGIWTVAFSPDGTRTTVGAFDGSVEIRDATTDQLLVGLDVGARVMGIAWSHDGSRIAIATDDALARVFRTGDRSDPRTLSGHRSTVTTAAFSLDGALLVTGSYDDTARVWDAFTGKPLSDPMPHGGPIFGVAVALSPDGGLAVTGCDDRTARIWDVATSQPIGPALKHEAAVHMVAFPTDSQVRTGTSLGTVRFWDIRVSPLSGDVERIRLWIEVSTGFELDAKGSLRALDAPTWKRRRARLAELGGPPGPTR